MTVAVSRGPLLVLVAGLALVVQPAAANWRSTHTDENPEPNALPDLEGSSMWPQANQGEERLYFDAVVRTSTTPPIPNPNPKGTAVRSLATTSFDALLGFWRDCNGDGFVGSAITGERTYDVTQWQQEAALNQFYEYRSVCPIGEIDGDAQAQIDFLYNDGTQVYELLPIGPHARDAEPRTLGDAEQESNEGVMCPDGDPGPSGSRTTSPNHPRSGTTRVHRQDAVLEDGDNLACLTGTQHAVQDDFARVWHIWGLPTDSAAQTRTMVPPAEGTMRDSNGFFRYVDSATFGTLQRATGLWPANQGSQDPADGHQCEPHADPTEESEAHTGVAAVDNVWTFTEKHDEPPETAPSQDPQETEIPRGRCSPVANMQYIDLGNGNDPEATFAWPLHLAEERWHNGDGSEPARPITDPWANDCEGWKGTGVQDDVDGWDSEEDGDPIADDERPWKYYGPNEDGASVEPAIASLLSWTRYHVLFQECQASRDPLVSLEQRAPAGGTTGRVSVDTTFTYVPKTAYNPSRGPGLEAATTDLCIPNQAALEGPATQCAGFWKGNQRWIHTHGVQGAAPAPHASLVATFYADVSFGKVVDDGTCAFGFDPAGLEHDDWAGSGRCFPRASNPSADLVPPAGPDGDDRGGVFDAGPLAPSLHDNASSYGDYLPAGSDNAHVLADHQCGGLTAPSIDPLDTRDDGTDAFESNPSAYDGLGKWVCDRQVWADAQGIDCSLEGPDPDPTDELRCYLLPKPGDYYDLRDVECFDNDVDYRDTLATRDCDLVGRGTR